MHEEKGAFRFFEIYFSNSCFFSFACTYFVYFWVWQFKNKIKNKSYPSITIFVIQCLKFPRVCLYKSSICLASFWYTCRLHFVFFLLILLIYLISWERKHDHSFINCTSFFHPIHTLNCLGFTYLFLLVELLQFTCHGGARVK